MGCTASKESKTASADAAASQDARTEKPSPAVAGRPPASPPAARTSAELFMLAVAPSYWNFVLKYTSTIADATTRTEVREAEWRSFVSTCDVVMVCELTATKSERRVAIEAAREAANAPTGVDVCKVADDRLGVLLEAWLTLSDEASTVNKQKAEAILKQAKVFKALPAKQSTYSFGDLVELTLSWTNSSGLDKLFDTMTDNKEVMSAEQLAKFASYGATSTVTEDEAKDLIAKRLGGAVTRLRFILFFGNPATNDVLDPKRALSVWQDMSQPLTRYSILTRSVTNEDDLMRAIGMGTRAFVINARMPAGSETPIMSKNTTLASGLQLLRTHAFKTNPLPVILCFLPHAEFNVATQDAVAAVLEKELGDALAPGLMFNGSHITDPKFTPLGLQHRFLVMAQQGPLKPFVGFSVADMQRSGLGVRVTAVPEGTPAARAGIGKQDWLTHFNGEPIDSKDGLKHKLAALTFGDEFRVRKEGLTEVGGIVGASVGDDTENTSKKFSSLLFLNYIGNNNNATNGDHQHLPWDIYAEQLPLSEHHASHRRSSSHIQTPSSRAHSPGAEVYPYHFRFVARDPQHQDTEEKERAVSDADRDGVQFIDTENSPAAERWARGKFADNGHCGYVLQYRPHSSRGSDADSDADMRREDEIPDAVHLDVELLALADEGYAHGDTAATPSPDDLSCAVAVIGTPERHRQPFQAHALVDVDDPAGKVVMLRTRLRTGSPLEAALPAHLVRPGYRIVSFVKDSEPSFVFPVLCAIRRSQTRAVHETSIAKSNGDVTASAASLEDHDDCHPVGTNHHHPPASS